jgi:hypothetical protein
MVETIDRYDEKMLAIINGPFNHRQTRETWSCIDREGNYIPWYTFPAIEYLNDLDLSDKTAFEYGSGFSSLYWAKRAKHVLSVERDPAWIEKTRGLTADNQEILLRPDQDAYVSEISRHGSFDIVIIDGDWRLDCADIAATKLKPGGLVILDNSDWYVKAAARLHGEGYLQVDMKGLGPINPYCWCTSFFFDRAFNFQKRYQFQPTHGLGARDVFAQEEWPEGMPSPAVRR